VRDVLEHGGKGSQIGMNISHNGVTHPYNYNRFWGEMGRGVLFRHTPYLVFQIIKCPPAGDVYLIENLFNSKKGSFIELLTNCLLGT
jgi:hypothetical protein